MISIFSFPDKGSSITLLLICSIIVLGYGYWSRQRIIPPGLDGEVELRPTLIPLVGGLLFIAIYAVIIIYPFFAPMRSGLNTILGGIFFLPLLIIGMINVRHYFNHRVKFNDDKLTITKWNGKSSELNWSDIIDVERGMSLPVFTPFYIKLKTSFYSNHIDFTLTGFKVFEYYLDRNNPDMGLALVWRIYHNNDPGNGTV